MSDITQNGINRPSAAHDVRTVAGFTHELNYGAAIFRIIYERLGLHKYFADKKTEYQLDFDLDAVVFCICFFNIEYKLTAPLDLSQLAKRRCIFNFESVTPDKIKRTLDVLQLFESDFLSFINKKARRYLKNRGQQVKHSPNSKVVLKSLAHLLRSVFFQIVAEAGFTITKEPLFTLTFAGTVLKPSDPVCSQGYVHLNKAFGRYGSGSDDELLTVRKLMKIFGIDAALPMRCGSELKKAIRVHFPFADEFFNCPQKLPKPAGEPDIDLKFAQDTSKLEGVDFLFSQNPNKNRAAND